MRFRLLCVINDGAADAVTSHRPERFWLELREQLYRYVVNNAPEAAPASAPSGDSSVTADLAVTMRHLHLTPPDEGESRNTDPHQEARGRLRCLYRVAN